MKLYDFQQKIIDNITEAAMRGDRKIAIVAPCGSGKTVLFSRIIQHATQNGMKSLVLVHRRELIFQTEEKLKRYDVPCGIILQDEPHDSSLPVQVASIQTLYSRAIRRESLTLPQADLVVVDELHHIPSSRTWTRIIESYKNAFVIGFTATPCNKKGLGLAGHFDSLICGPSIKTLTEQGYLVPIKYYVPSIPDLTGIKIRSGDYAEEELENRMNTQPLIGDICENWARVCPGRKTLVFASGVKHSIHIAKSFNDLGIKAAHIDGETPTKERDEIVKRFSDGDIQVLTNCQVFTEGTDIPCASALVFARPTKSLLLFLQVAGRGLRPYPLKQDCVLLDHSGVVFEHGLIDEDRDWTLEHGTGNFQGGKLRKKKEPKVIVCEKCKRLYSGRIECPDCGWKPEIKGKYIPTVSAYLQALKEAKMPPKADKETWWRGLSFYAREKGYRSGWAWFKYKEKFGCGPAPVFRNLIPIEPNLEIRSWIRHKQIQWAYSRRNQASPIWTK